MLQNAYTRVARNMRELNLVGESQIAITNVLSDLSLAVQYGIAICIYVSKNFWHLVVA